MVKNTNVMCLMMWKVFLFIWFVVLFILQKSGQIIVAFVDVCCWKYNPCQYSPPHNLTACLVSLFIRIYGLKTHHPPPCVAEATPPQRATTLLHSATTYLSCRRHVEGGGKVKTTHLMKGIKMWFSESFKLSVWICNVWIYFQWFSWKDFEYKF